MRKGISLIELVFTIVIIAIVFTVIPKMVFALNKSEEFSIKQDALFNGVTLMQMISRLSWDENSTQNNALLNVLNGNTHFTCNNDINNSFYHYRIGGFKGSRNCSELNNTLIASTIGKDASEINSYSFDDIDDFNAYDINTSFYQLSVAVNYINDADVVITYSGLTAKIDLTKSSIMPASQSTHLKKVHIDINTSYTGNKKNLESKKISQFDYVSANVGKMFLAKRVWL